MNDLRSGVCFLLRRGSNTASSFLKARDKQPQVRLFTSIYDFTRIYSLNTQLRIKQFEGRMWGGVQWHVQVEGVELIRGCITSPRVRLFHCIESVITLCARAPE